MKKLLFIFILIYPLVSYSVDYISNDNITGWWNDAGSWSGGVPLNDAINLGGGTLTINGFIKWQTSDPLDSTLSMGGGSGGDIVVNDTLVIFGNLDLGNRYNITVNGILIVYGNITTTNKITISSSGYLIVQGDMDFGGAQGIIEPGDESNVYIGGSCTNGTGCANTSNDSTDLDNSDIDVSDFYDNTDPNNICTEPTIDSSTPGARCGSGTVTLGATASAGTINWYSVATGGSSLGTGTSFTTPSISTTTNYYVDATDGSCTTASRTLVVATVNPLPSVTTSATPDTICYGEFSVLNATGGVSYSWTPILVGEIDDQNIQSPTYTPAANPTSPTQITTTFTVTVIDVNTCSDTGTVDVVVTRVPITGPQYHISNEYEN